MNFGSVCSGIEAASVAWEPLGWKAQFFSEIEAFPRAVLAHHYPHVVNHGDMTKFKGWPDHAIDLLVGGTPCQSFSIAGLRAGLADPRGDLMLTYLAIAAKYRPRWLAWENVPGVLSSGGGRDFGTFLGGLVELGYGYAYRVLDAQFCRTFGFPFAVPQRRRRVFVIGYLGDWRPAAAVLFDAACLRGDHPPRRETGQRTSGTLAARAGGGGRPDGGDGRHDQLIATSGTIDAAQGRARGAGINPGQIIGVPDIVSQAMTAKWSKGSSGPAGDEVVNLIPIVPPLRGGDGGGSHGPGTDNDTADSLIPISSIAFPERMSSTQSASAMDLSPALGAGALRENPESGPDGVGVRTDTIEARAEVQAVFIQQQWAVRRLSVTECERLQGYRDGYTDVPYRKRPSTPDGPRYKALGNSMATNVMRAIGERIDMVECLISK